MKTLCNRVQTLLTERGRPGLKTDTAAQEHLVACSTCFAFLEAWELLETSWTELPAEDASDALVARVLAQVQDQVRDQLQDQEPDHSAPRRWWRWLAVRFPRGFGLPSRRAQWVAGLSFALTAVFVMTVLMPRFEKAPREAYVAGDTARDPWAGLNQTPGVLTDRINVGGNESGQQKQFSTSTPAPETLVEVEDLRALGYLDGVGQSADAAGAMAVPSPPAAPSRESRLDSVPLAEEESEPSLQIEAMAFVTPPELAGAELLKPATDDRSEIDLSPIKETLVFGFEAGGGDESGTDEPSDGLADWRRNAEGQLGERNRAVGGDRRVDGDDLGFEVGAHAQRSALDFLAERSQVDGVATQAAEGYWSNTYVPGDSSFRLLQSRLLGGDGSAADLPAALQLHEGAHQTAQPFDPPQNAALAVYTAADRSGLSGPGRLLIQVGLQATQRRGGHRPALHLALVLDLPAAINPEVAASLRALVLALAESRELGDRFFLIVAGRPGALLMEPHSFRHGPLRVALDQLLGVGGSSAPTLDLYQAAALAIDRVTAVDDPNAPLGGSVVLLATARPLGPEVDRLAGLAHRSAVAGVPISAIGIGDNVARAELDRLALAGQGSRRLLGQPAEAGSLIDRELSAVSRLVARALRLRIRLAPGVELVEVLGAKRLEAARAEEVREAERSIDQRLARNLGIEADRGEDEEGIQIVVPSFYAGDAHVVLLDVLAPGPGAIADVTVRYKDLVYLRNGVARAHLSLARGDRPRGQLELNVLKNLLAYRLFETLEEAGSRVAHSDAEGARRQLEEFAALLQGLRVEVAGLEQDGDLLADRALLAQYLAALAGSEAPMAATRQQLSDSLRYAARLKILPQPASRDQGDRP